jgi:hypothetical protein
MVLRAMRRYDDGYQSEKQQANIMKEEKEKGKKGGGVGGKETWDSGRRGWPSPLATLYNPYLICL